MTDQRAEASNRRGQALRLVPPPGLARADFQSAIEDELSRIILLFSHWEPRSELARFNAAPAGFWAVSEPFWSLLNAALDLADDTSGAVDPTLGALVDLWGFGPPGPRPLDAFGKGYTVPFEDRFNCEFIERRGDYGQYGAVNAPVRLAALAQLRERR